MALMQATRAISISTPLGRDVLLFQRMTATESLGQLFEYEIDLLSERQDLALDQILGKKITVSLELPGGRSRYFNGFVCRFAFLGIHDRFAAYRAVVRPFLWFLTRTADCRIFQEKTAPEIVKQVLRDQGFTDIEDNLSGSYRTLPYCVQYRETDFNFISRLMEQEGIYYYFRHDPDKHMLVLADSASGHAPAAGYERIPYFPPDVHDRRERDHIYDWTVAQEIQSGAYALNDFNFEKPRASLRATAKQAQGHPYGSLELYDYPGEYQESGEGDAYAGVRMQEVAAQYERKHGESNARGLLVGALFQLENFHRREQNREYLIVSATHSLESDDYRSADQAAGGDIYRCAFTAIDSRQPFRPPRVTPKPVVQGPQTAIVTGPPGDEIHTDKYGRVKVQFHWDREGKRDENSSCWVRVAQVWAGKSWGGMNIPRIGQEVIVEFLEGDPDRPIVTGRVYNADNMPPYGLPGEATKSTLKSNSSKGGGGFNEIRMEDKKGGEEFFVHAQKDMSRIVLNDEDDRVDGARKRKVGKNETVDIGQDQTVKIGKNLLIEAGMQITLKCGLSTIVLKKDGTITVKGMNVTVQGDAKVENKSTGQAILKGTMTNVDGTAVTIVKGGIVKIN